MNIEPMEIIIHIINIIVLFFILRLLLYKPIHNYLTARAGHVSSQLEEAKGRQAEAMKTKEQYDRLMADSKKEADEKISEIILKAHADAEIIIQKANEKASSVVDEAKKQAEIEKKNILKDMRDEIADFSLNIARKILSREINEIDNRKIIDSFFEGRE